ncbi:MAG: FecR domain-containing protein [Candidatus Auribacterota bacterium]|nr:FecR domain-containing protein [Candidatus Auribacterota bacterium]
MHETILTILVLFLISSSAGFAEEDYAIPVKTGDTSSSIVDSYLVNPAAWQQVKDYNHLLKDGNIIKVPAHLITLKGKAVISLVYGQVRIKLADEERWISAIPGLIIQKGDYLETGFNSGVEITLEEGDRALLRENTSLVFNPPGETREGTTLLNVLRGKVISFVNKTPNRDLRYQIQTPTAVSLVRGTIFRTKVSDANETIFEVLDGVVNIQAEGKELNLDGDFGIKI